MAAQPVLRGTKNRVQNRRLMMASLPLPALPGQPENSASKGRAPIVGTVPPARLSALEWSIVAMAQRDGLASIRERSRFIAALGSLFGFRQPNRLANDRLEALRRVSILAWHYRWNVPKSEVADFLAAGFSIDQYELIQTSIGQARQARGRRTVR
jgi:hypothetical protein